MAKKDSEAQFIDVDRLRIGMYVHLDLGWMQHPFALNSFKITSREQIDTIVGLGISRIRWSPEKSDPEPTEEPGTAAKAGVTEENSHGTGATANVAAVPVADAVATASAEHAVAESTVAESAAAEQTAEEQPAAEQRRLRRDRQSLQFESLEVCERNFAHAGRAYRQILDNVRAQPEVARTNVERTISTMVDKLFEHEELAIRLLSENAGEKSSLHAINVTVISLLLGKAMELGAEELRDLGSGALLHDIGKIALPERLRWKDEQFNNAERRLFEEHVVHGASLSQSMRLPAPVQAIIAQHHEFADGRGYPRKLAGDAIAPLARIVALVNHYDNLCNPGNPTQAITPHEALSQIFAQMKRQFDPAVLTLFIRMMGVYPPGSVVELTDGRHALVVSVNSSRPLKPQIVIYEPRVPREEALVEDLETMPDIGIRRSLKPLQLPKAAFDYLSPRLRVCYFFERARSAQDGEGEA
jgi:putative nucleotidyltransferase with HDIG domain